MTDSGGSGGETGVPNSGSATFAPFEAWSQWMRDNMGATSATQSSTGEEASEPEEATSGDPLMSAMGKLSDANPMSNIIPLDWMEISKALQTLWKREMSDPQRAMQVATDYNRRLFETKGPVQCCRRHRHCGPLAVLHAITKRAPPSWRRPPLTRRNSITVILRREHAGKSTQPAQAWLRASLEG